MKLLVVSPRVEQYNLYLDKDDELYLNCMYAKFTFDCDNFILSAVTDCGDYIYKWPVTDSEKFMHLMARINQYYLVGKVSEMTELDVEATRKNILDAIEYDDADIDHKESAKKFIHDLSFSSVYELNEELEDYNDSYCGNYFSDYIVEEYISFDYPFSAQIFGKIFEKYIQPEIRKRLVN